MHKSGLALAMRKMLTRPFVRCEHGEAIPYLLRNCFAMLDNDRLML